MSKLISDEDYKMVFGLAGEIAAMRGLLAAVTDERDFLRKQSDRAANPKEHPCILKDVDSVWSVTRGEHEATCWTRMVGGVLCRWWGEGPTPSGVHLIDAAIALRAAQGSGAIITQQTEGRLMEAEKIDGGVLPSFDPNAPQELKNSGGALRPS